MSELLLPGFSAQSGGGPFNRRFFAELFKEGHAPPCSLIGDGDVPVVELQLINGETCDVYYFEAFRRDFLVAQLFVDPPKCEDFYQSFIRYETIFRMNVRYYKPPLRKLGFKDAQQPEVDEDDDDTK